MVGCTGITGGTHAEERVRCVLHQTNPWRKLGRRENTMTFAGMQNKETGRPGNQETGRPGAIRAGLVFPVYRSPVYRSPVYRSPVYRSPVSRPPPSFQPRQAAFQGQDGGLGTVVGLELLDNGADVVLDCAFGQEQRLGDFLVRLALDHLLQDGQFPLG